MDLGLRGKTAVVAAASKGLGKAVAKALAREGANVVMFSRSQSSIDAAVQEILSGLPAGPRAERGEGPAGSERETGGEGGQVVGLAADVTNPADLERVVQTAVDRFGGVDILYNNAGGPKPGLFDDLTDADWDNAYQLNLMSAVRLTRLCLPHMRRKHWGRIVTGTSSSVKQPIANLMLSNSLRSATTAWSKTLADQVGPDGITVNTIEPGTIDTERIRQLTEFESQRSGRSVEELQKGRRQNIPLRRVGTPDEFGAAAAFLASEAASYLNGVTLMVDGGAYRGTY